MSRTGHLSPSFFDRSALFYPDTFARTPRLYTVFSLLSGSYSIKSTDRMPFSGLLHFRFPKILIMPAPFSLFSIDVLSEYLLECLFQIIHYSLCPLQSTMDSDHILSGSHLPGVFFCLPCIRHCHQAFVSAP